MANGSETDMDKSKNEVTREPEGGDKDASAGKEEREEQEGPRTKKEKSLEERRQLVERLKELDRKRKEIKASAEGATATQKVDLEGERERLDRQYAREIEAARQVVFSGKDERDLQDEAEPIQEKFEAAMQPKGEPINYEEERRVAREEAESGDPVKELKGLIKLDRMERREEEYEEAVSVREGRGVEREPAVEEKMHELVKQWQEVQEKKSEIQVDEEDKVKAAEAEENRILDQAVKVDSQIREDKEEIDRVKRDADDPRGIGRLVGRLEEMIEEASELERTEKDKPEAKMRTAYLRRERKRVDEELLKAPEASDYARKARGIEERRQKLLRRFIDKDISSEQFQAESQRLSQEARELRDEATLEIGSRGQMYERMPKQKEGQSDEEYEDDLELWVWKKIKAIDTASISPSALVYSPAYTSLLYALTEAKLPPRLKNNINAWRSVYEVALIWDASGRPEDVLQRAADLDPDAFLGLIGQYEREKDGHIKYEKNTDGSYKLVRDKKVPIYTEQARAIQKAFAELEKVGKEFAHGSTNESRNDLHASVAGEIEKSLPDRHKNLGLGDVYERIAYRYWKILGREGRFDRPMVKAERVDNGMKVGEKIDIYRKYKEYGKEVYKKEELKRGDRIETGDLVPMGETGDIIASRRRVDRRYNWGYSKTSIKFWYRRLLPGGLYQEKNIKFIPELLNGFDYPTQDFLTSNLKVEGEDSPVDNCKELITDTALQFADWENKTGTYGVWIDDLRKAAETRSEAIKADGPLNSPHLPDARARADMRAKMFETHPDKANTAFAQLLDSEIAAHRKQNLFDGVPILGNLPIPHFVFESKRDEHGNPVFGFPYIRIAWSEAQARTGIPYAALGRAGIEDTIVEWIADGTVSAYEGEEIMRRRLAVLGIIPGIGPVRFAARLAEGVFNAGNIFGLFWAMFAKFFEEVVPQEAGLGGGKKRK